VIKRPRAEIAVAGAAIEAARDVRGVAQHVVVREHHAFRVRRGARRELHQQHVVGCHGRNRQFARVCATCDEIRIARRRRWHVLAEHDHVAQLRQRRVGQLAVDRRAEPAQHADKIDFEETIDHEQQLDVGLLDAIFEFVGFEARVDGHCDGAERGGRAEKYDPLDRIAHAHGDVVAAADAARVQRGGSLPDVLPQLRVGKAPPRNHERFLRRALTRRVGQRRGKGLAGPVGL
jgi:hypothetical protein